MRTATKLFLFLSMSLIFANAIESQACSNIIVTKGASADGSNMVSYCADSHYLYGELYYAPAGVWNKGNTRQIRKINDWDTGKYLGEIPQVARTYQRVGNMNEHQLIIGETTFGGHEELWDSTGVMDYGGLIYVALERTKTAREAIKLMAELANQYGYYSSGETFSIADKNEVWIMELIGKGPNNKGIVWVALRVPDGYICAHANQPRITTFPLNDPENCMYAPDVISFARSQGYFNGEDKDFSFCHAYDDLVFSTIRACDARVWSAFNRLCDGQFTFEDENGKLVTRNSYDYLDYAMGYNTENKFPLFLKPSRKLSVKDVADAMRDHYEGTPMDMTTDIGAGGNALPYRWRPMRFKYEGKTYINERAIATQQTGFWFVAQARSQYPDEIGGINWFGCDDAATSYLTPIYACTTEVPECFRVGNGNMLTYSPTSAFWMNNRVANACYKAYNIMFPTVDAEIDAWENAMIQAVAEADKAALELYRKTAGKPARNLSRNDDERKVAGKFTKVRKYLTDFSVSNAQKIFDKWVALEQHLLVKYMDGNVKAQNPDGSFASNPFTDRIPADIEHPEYTDKWKECVVRDKGEILESK